MAKNLTYAQIVLITDEVTTSRAREILWSRAHWEEQVAQTKKLVTSASNALADACMEQEPVDVIEDLDAMTMIFEECHQDAKEHYAKAHALYLGLVN